MGGALEVLRTDRLSHSFEPHHAGARDEGTLIDISVPYAAEVPVWPGDVPFSCGWTARRETGSSVNLGVVNTSVHAGTHADAPLHVESAWGASETLPAHAFVGEAQVIALAERVAANGEITRDMLVAALSSATLKSSMNATVHEVPRRLLCRTGYSVSHGAFPQAWPVLSVDAAEWLVQSGVVLWGTDAPSVDVRTSTTLPVHHALFGGGAYVLENLALDGIAAGRYELLAQPMALHGADAAPVRAMLREWAGDSVRAR